MKKPIGILLILFFGFTLSAQEKKSDSLKKGNTRKYSIEEVVIHDSINTSPLLEIFKGASPNSVKQAYKLNRMAVDSILKADSLEANFWRIYGYQAAHLFVQANKSPSMALSIFLPLFLLIFIIILVVVKIKLIVLRPEIGNAVKPKNDPHKNNNYEEKDDDDEEDDDEVLGNEKTD
jgi:hypothetical protein